MRRITVSIPNDHPIWDEWDARGLHTRKLHTALDMIDEALDMLPEVYEVRIKSGRAMSVAQFHPDTGALWGKVCEGKI